MWLLLLLLIGSNVSLYIASYLQSRGYVTGYQVCANAFGMCDHLEWLAVASAICAVVFLIKNRAAA